MLRVQLIPEAESSELRTSGRRFCDPSGEESGCKDGVGSMLTFQSGCC